MNEATQWIPGLISGLALLFVGFYVKDISRKIDALRSTVADALEKLAVSNADISHLIKDLADVKNIALRARARVDDAHSRLDRCTHCPGSHTIVQAGD